MNLSIGLPPLTMAKNNAITPEYLYYFEMDQAPAPSAADDLPSQKSGGWKQRLARALFFGLVKICLVVFTLSAPIAAPIDDSGSKKEHSIRGADALRAQMSALRGELADYKRIRTFLGNDDGDGSNQLARARYLIETLPTHEDASAAAWRIAAIASLNLESGTLAGIESEYRLLRGAVGWDFGPESQPVQRGFAPVTPEDLGEGNSAGATPGVLPLTDGIVATGSFDGSLPNGLYRILIVREGGLEEHADAYEGGIAVNGVPVNARSDSDRTGESNSHARAVGHAIQSWAVVHDGRLQIDFSGLTADRTISAVIAEQIEIDKIDLQPRVAETFAEALGSIGPASGPSRKTRPGPSRSAKRTVGAVPQQAGTVTAAAPEKPARAANARISSGFGFAARRQSASFPGSVAPPQTAAAPSVVEAESAAGADFESALEGEEGTVFEDRQILVKRSAGKGSDSDGQAVDLGSLLDDGSLSGVFLCESDLCTDLPPIADEPDLLAAFELLGDWLQDPANLNADWSDLESVLAARAAGSEIAAVYAFDVDSEGWTDVELRLSAGSGLFVWLDGEYIFGASETGVFVDDLNFEYRIELDDLSAGPHFLQLLSENHGGAPGYALELRGTPTGGVVLAATQVPEPSSLIVLGLGLIGLGVFARSRRFS